MRRMITDDEVSELAFKIYRWTVKEKNSIKLADAISSAVSAYENDLQARHKLIAGDSQAQPSYFASIRSKLADVVEKTTRDNSALNFNAQFNLVSDSISEDEDGFLKNISSENARTIFFDLQRWKAGTWNLFEFGGAVLFPSIKVRVIKNLVECVLSDSKKPNCDGDFDDVGLITATDIFESQDPTQDFLARRVYQAVVNARGFHQQFLFTPRFLPDTERRKVVPRRAHSAH